MFSIGQIWNRRPSRERLDWTLHTCATPRPMPFPSTRRHTRQASASPHIYFYVRSFAADGRGHVLQYSFVDDRGNVVLSAFAASASPVGLLTGQPPEDLPVEPLEQEELDYLIGRVCAGALLVGYGRVLQGGLLPAQAVQASAGIECAWRRFHKVSRAVGIHLDRSEGLCLEDALVRVGLPGPDSCDAAMRALAIRDLWGWMDRVE